MLPDFTLGSYDEALRTCQKEARIGCIILVSEEHDDVTEFKRWVFIKMLEVFLKFCGQIDAYGFDLCKIAI